MIKQGICKNFSRMFLIVTFFLIGACAIKAPKGIVVNVLRPITMEEGINCGKISLIFVDLQTFPSNELQLTSSEETMLIEEARSKIERTGFLQMNEGILRDHHSNYHFLTFKIYKLTIKRNSGNKIASIGVSASFSKGNTECYTVNFMEEFTRSENASDWKFKRDVVAKALDNLIRKFVPKKVKTLRPVFGASGDAARISDLLNGGNCKLALSLAKIALKKNPNDKNLLYNAGVAIECLASNTINQQQKVALLEKAQSYYLQALHLDSDQEEIQRAEMEVEIQRELYKETFRRQKDVIKKSKKDEGTRIY